MQNNNKKVLVLNSNSDYQPLPHSRTWKRLPNQNRCTSAWHSVQPAPVEPLGLYSEPRWLDKHQNQSSQRMLLGLLQALRSWSSSKIGPVQMHKSILGSCMCTALQNCSNTKKLKRKKNPSGSETNTLLLLMNLFIYAGDQVIPHDFTRHFSLWSLFPKQSQEKLTKPKVSSFRYLLKTSWAVELKVKAKSTAIPVFTGLCIQSSESYDKCTVQH